jgi:hypothetical protein
MSLPNIHRTHRLSPWFFAVAVRLLLASVAALALCLTSSSAFAWIDSHIVSDDVRLELDREGHGLVSHVLVMKIKGGPLKQFILPGTDLDAVYQQGAQVARVSDKKGDSSTTESFELEMIPQPEGGVVIHILNDQGIGRGRYVFKFQYRTNLLKGGGLLRDGSMVRLRWVGPEWPNGVSTAKTTLVFPSAPTEPHAASDRPTDATLDKDLAVSGAGSFLTTLRRFPKADELELIRPHVAKGERVVWTARFDPSAISMVKDPRVQPPPSAHVMAHVESSSRERQVFLAVALGMAILFCALTAIKVRQVALQAESVGVVPQGVIPMRPGLRVLFSGPLIAIGVALQLFLDPPWWGTVVLVAAMVVMAHRTPQPKPAVRGPGRWLALSDDDGFCKPLRARDTWLDISTRSGKIAFVVCLLILGGIYYATQLVSPYHAQLAVLDGVILLSLFGTGRSNEMPPSLATTPVPVLRKIAGLLRKKDKSMRVVPWARFEQGAANPDELRLLVMPKKPIRGLTSVEVGYTFPVGGGGFLPCPEVLIRVTEESAAEEKARSIAPFGRWVRGRKPGERVLALEPRFPTWRMTAALALRMVHLLGESSDAPKPKREDQSAGKAASTKKPETFESPFQPNEAAWSA